MPMMVAHDDSHDDACCGDCSTGGNGGTATAVIVLIKYDDTGFYLLRDTPRFPARLAAYREARGDT